VEAKALYRVTEAQDADAPNSVSGAVSGKLLLTVEEASARLGFGRTLMYDLIRTGAVESVQIGRLRRIHPADLEAYAAGLRNANSAPNTLAA
jgi:excisionase family DNA binding protein